ncbi:hypothetical protein FKM82_008833 [Ascaphus truei]
MRHVPVFKAAAACIVLTLSLHECGMNAVKCVAFEKNTQTKSEMLENKRGSDSMCSLANFRWAAMFFFESSSFLLAILP